MAITFPIFAFEPDLSKSIGRLATTAQDVLRLSGAQALITWPADRVETSLRLTYSLRGATTTAAAKAFLAARAGQHEAFLLPTWQRDFSLITPSTLGDTSLAVAVDDYAALYLTTTADDEPGRFLFTWDPDNGLFATRIIRATADAPGTSLLELEDALPWTPAAGAIWGHLLLVRMSDDQIAIQHMTPTHITFELAVITVRQRSTANEDLRLEGSTGPEATEPFTAATFRAEDSPRLRFDYAHALGPVNLHFPQDETFATPWALWLGSQRVRMKKGAVEGDIWPPADDQGITSDLFPSGKPTTTHISLAFDQNSWEVVAWENTAAGTVTIRRRFNGVIVEHTFEGRSPALFFNGIIAVAARLTGGSDVVVYYDKPGHNCIFARIQRENFGTEYAVVLGPAKIRRMIDAASDGTVGTIRFIDDSFRVVTLRTEPLPEIIVPPSPIVYGLFEEQAGVTTLIEGDYFLSVLMPDGPTQDPANLSASLAGEVIDEIVSSDTMERAALLVSLTGGIVPTTIVTSQTDLSSLSVRLVGTYFLAITSASASTDTASATYELSGSLT